VIVENVSTRGGTPGVADSTADQHPPSGVKERQAAGLGLFSHHGQHFLDSLWPLALVWSPSVHLGSLAATLARRRRLDAETLKEFREFRAWAFRVALHPMRRGRQ
jgi:hypothetical protein